MNCHINEISCLSLKSLVIWLSYLWNVRFTKCPDTGKTCFWTFLSWDVLLKSFVFVINLNNIIREICIEDLPGLLVLLITLYSSWRKTVFLLKNQELQGVLNSRENQKNSILILPWTKLKFNLKLTRLKCWAGEETRSLFLSEIHLY